MNKVTPVESKESDKMEMNLDGDLDNLGVERMETDNDELNLVLEETQPEPPAPASKAPLEIKKRVPLTTIITGSNAGSSSAASTAVIAATPEKTKKRVNLITLSSPKPKS